MKRRKMIFLIVRLYQVQVTSLCRLKLTSSRMVNVETRLYGVRIHQSGRATSIVELFGSSSSESSSPLESWPVLASEDGKFCVFCTSQEWTVLCFLHQPGIPVQTEQPLESPNKRIKFVLSRFLVISHSHSPSSGSTETQPSTDSVLTTVK